MRSGILRRPNSKTWLTLDVDGYEGKDVRFCVRVPTSEWKREYTAMAKALRKEKDEARQQELLDELTRYLFDIVVEVENLVIEEESGDVHPFSISRSEDGQLGDEDLYMLSVYLAAFQDALSGLLVITPRDRKNSSSPSRSSPGNGGTTRAKSTAGGAAARKGGRANGVTESAS